MATSSADEREQPRSLWESFDRDDKKVFLVTFAGTVAANVVTVMVLAIAVIIARPSVSGQPRTVGNIVWYVRLGAIFTLAAAGIVYPWCHRDKRARQRRTGWLFMGVIFGFFGLLCIMGAYRRRLRRQVSHRVEPPTVTSRRSPELNRPGFPEEHRSIS